MDSAKRVEQVRTRPALEYRFARRHLHQAKTHGRADRRGGQLARDDGPKHLEPGEARNFLARSDSEACRGVHGKAPFSVSF
jgi:hypothetical protein